MSKSQVKITMFLSLFFGAIFILLFGDPALASDIEKSNTSFDRPLSTLRGLFNGPIPLTASLLGFIGGGCALVFGGELTAFAKSMLTLICVIAMMAFAGSILETFFGLGGAVVTEVHGNVYESLILYGLVVISLIVSIKMKFLSLAKLTS